jgi:hypothetical protein
LPDLWSTHRSAPAATVFDRTDEDIRTDIVDAILRHEFLIDPRQFRVTVESAVVTMEGTLETAALGRAMIRKARHVPAWWRSATGPSDARGDGAGQHLRVFRLASVAPARQGVPSATRLGHKGMPR